MMPNLTVSSGKSSRWRKDRMLCRSAIIIMTLLSFAGPTHEEGAIPEVKAVVKGTARLPCDIVPPVSNDSVILVIWYKNMTPIYSFDLRGTHSDVPSHWKSKDILDERGYFLTVTDPATLSLNNVDERDEGVYRCRVDFRRSRSHNFKVRLTIITPPMNPTVFDDRGKEVVNVAGPYEEGREMKLLCVVSGGRPLPTVRWWRDAVLVDNTDEEYAHPGKVKQNQLIVPELKRSDLHAVYTCEASNNNISQPARASVTIDMRFKPLSASILSSNQPLSADRKYNIECQSVGSRPAANITWWMDTKALGNYVEKVSSDGNITYSTLTFTPTLADHGKTLTCRAVNKFIDAAVEEDSWKLNVFFVPMLKLELGLNLNPDDIEEGDDVYFECKVHANPWAYKVVWKHNSQTVQHNQKDGVIVSDKALALQHVRRQQAGNYTCIASNVEGDGESNTVELRVMYKPVCRPDQKRVYGVARHENAHVVCEVEAYPPPDSFKWSFNNTAETIDVPQARYRTSTPANGPSTSQSNLTYTPMTEMDYGTVMCWASNTAGQQKEPCVFHIIAAGHPDTPFNCTLLNQTTESLEVDCVEGFDGGQPQYFLLEVFDMQTGMLQANISSKFPLFSVTGLGPGMVLKMLVYAANSKGKSEPAIVEGFTLKVAEKQTGTPVPFELNPVLGILIGVVAVLLVVAIVIVGALRVRAQNRGNSSRPGDLALKEKAALPLRSNVEDLYEMDDKNPDVIPCNKDSDYQLVSEAQTPGVNNQTPPELPSYDEHPKRNNVSRNGDLFENFKNNRDRYPPAGHAASDEVTYAELCLTRPTSLQDPSLVGGNCKAGSGVVLGGGGVSAGIVRGREEPTIYAQIDHTRRPQPPPVIPQGCDTPQPTALSPLVSPVSCAPLTHPAMLHREIVTVRTPLMANQQESCV